MNKTGFDLISNSDDWAIARTIYASFTVKGKIGIEKISESVSRLSMGFADFSISKLDFYKGLVDPDASKS